METYTSIKDKISVRIVAKSPDLIPTYGSEEAAGADLRANLLEPYIFEHGTTTSIPTGVYIELPYGFEAQVRPRSGLALKQQITVLNSPGTIDSDYRGEIHVLLINFGPTFIIEPKMRIAQLIIAPVVQALLIEVNALNSSDRGEKGFGHTGL